MIPELETHAEVHKTGHRWIDIVVAGCALLVSITSLFVAVRHGHTMERMAEANAKLVATNSWPLVQEYMSDVGERGQRVVSLNIVNSGVGPAKVESLEVSWQGRPMRSARELVGACCATEQDGELGQVLQVSSLQGMVLRAGEVRRVLELTRTAESERVASRLDASFKDLTFRACYCSVFDECWVTNLHTLHPEPAKACPPPQVPFGAE